MQVQIFGGCPLKTFGAKTCKISGDFTEFPNLIANISGTSQDIQNQTRYLIESDSSRIRRKKSGEL